MRTPLLIGGRVLSISFDFSVSANAGNVVPHVNAPNVKPTDTSSPNLYLHNCTHIPLLTPYASRPTGKSPQ
jgi:hypothetical protein